METSALAGARYLELPYRIILTKEKRKGADAWLALVEELPGCEARADTAEDATQAVRDEMAAWIEDALEQGRVIPRPRHQPHAADGRLAFDIPQSLHESLGHAAVREGLTVDQLVTIVLASVVDWRPGADEANGRWIQSQADALIRGRRQSGPVGRALMINAALLAVVVLVAVVILAVALAHGF